MRGSKVHFRLAAISLLSICVVRILSVQAFEKIQIRFINSSRLACGYGMKLHATRLANMFQLKRYVSRLSEDSEIMF
jgi:hypothetical protein